MEDVEFRLGRGYRARPLTQGCIALVLAAALYAAGLHTPALQWLAVFPLAYTAGGFAIYTQRRWLSTRLTPQGIEIRRYRRRRSRSRRDSRASRCGWAWEDLNLRPLPYQGVDVVDKRVALVTGNLECQSLTHGLLKAWVCKL